MNVSAAILNARRRAQSSNPLSLEAKLVGI